MSILDVMFSCVSLYFSEKGTIKLKVSDRCLIESLQGETQRCMDGFCASHLAKVGAPMHVAQDANLQSGVRINVCGEAKTIDLQKSC